MNFALRYGFITIFLNILSVHSLKAEVEFRNKSPRFEVATWNIQKASHTMWWTYIQTSQSTDFWAIQEATSHPEVLQFFQNNFFTDYNPAWSNSSYSTGTLSASKEKPIYVDKVITDVKEPLFLTPKSFIVSDLDFLCKEEIRILNVHMINFLLGSGFKNQLDQMSDFIKDFEGPLIVMGDFNTWNWLRKKTLLSWAKEHNLNLALPDDLKFQGLDHIFYKNLKLVQILKPKVRLADHEPIHGIFKCDRI